MFYKELREVISIIYISKRKVIIQFFKILQSVVKLYVVMQMSEGIRLFGKMRKQDFFKLCKNV